MTTTSTPSTPRRGAVHAGDAAYEKTGDAVWLRRLQLSVALGVVSVLVLGPLNWSTPSLDGGDFHSAADYVLTACGLPIALAGIGIVWSVHRLQHGADGRLGTIGVWVTTIALAELFVQLTAGLVVGSELRWGPMYVVSTALSFVGIALLAAGSWRSRMVPRWMLGVWPVLWVLGSFGAVGPVPAVLAAFLIALAVVVTRSVRSRQ